MAQLSCQWLKVFARKTQISANFPAEPWSQSSAWGEFAAVYEAFYRGAVCCAQGGLGAVRSIPKNSGAPLENGEGQENPTRSGGAATSPLVLQRGCGKEGARQGPRGAFPHPSDSGDRAGRVGPIPG